MHSVELSEKGGTRVLTGCRVHVTLLEPRALQRMHATEGAYSFVELQCADATLGHGAIAGPPLGMHLCGYVHQHGALLLGGEPLALAEIAVPGRCLRALPQATVQCVVKEWLKRRMATAEPDVDGSR